MVGSGVQRYGSSHTYIPHVDAFWLCWEHDASSLFDTESIHVNVVEGTWIVLEYHSKPPPHSQQSSREVKFDVSPRPLQSMKSEEHVFPVASTRS